ncbi:LacI family DNA-binding transcriptional regulator [Prauserella cavernicola]|uniref:LacI family DNA-binding transcriptional regulator n=1 Tax=Prauserella cavernicola TaxID=2800127 RepID=A0A934QPR1_9PSEU|nr:LacI family DNA-binding transcriptional regulator [Prauserella cavernicola]MBK1783917.1 LacI family DNA-binding transcriptional regulator [Prauserella cavernicola]
MDARDSARGAARLADVARRAGVSITTASHSFTGSRPVSATTKERVWQAALEVGFRHSQARRTVAVILRPPEAVPASRFGTTSFSQLIGGASMAAMTRGYSVVNARDVAEIAGSVPRLDGCLLLNPNRRDESLRWLRAESVPVVSYDQDPGDPGFRWWVGADYDRAVADLLLHMIGRSATRIALVAGQTDNMYRRAILATYDSVIRTAGLSSLVRIADNERGQSAAFETVSGLLDGPHPVEAVVTTSSVFAVGALTAARAAGRAVPDELMIATTTDGPLAELENPSITGLGIDALRTAEVMMDLLERQVAGQQPPETNPLVALNLIHRRST